MRQVTSGYGTLVLWRFSGLPGASISVRCANADKYYLTYELSVSSVHKGAARTAVTVSEPGGVVGGRGMTIAGSVEYSPGDQVAVFLQRMPNGYLRTAGWGQGKYLVDKAGHLHADGSLRGIEMVDTDRRDKSSVVAGTSRRALEGINIEELRARVLARVTTERQGSTK
jgi:hypothetical protein